jgi:hypothetical protein
MVDGFRLTVGDGGYESLRSQGRPNRRNHIPAASLQKLEV